MAVEKYIRGKHDDAHHVGRYSNVRSTDDATYRQTIALEVIVALQIVKVAAPGSEPYNHHKGVIDFWLGDDYLTSMGQGNYIDDTSG